jgi:hypothetical protein
MFSVIKGELTMKATRPSAQLCVLCGVRTASSGQGDHIPPKSLYTPAERTGQTFRFNVVPACTKCNNAGNKADEALKVMISVSSSRLRPDPKGVLEHAAKTLKNNGRLAHQFRSNSEHLKVISPRGKQTHVTRVKFDEALYVAALRRTVRGMYWKMTGDIIDEKANIAVILDPAQSDYLNFFFERSEMIRLIEVNNGTLKCQLADVGAMKIMRLIFFDIHFNMALI